MTQFFQVIINRYTLSFPNPQIAENYQFTWSSYMGSSNVIFETDAKVMVDALSSYDIDLTYLGVGLQDCKSLLDDMVNTQIVFTKRSKNMMPYTLVRVAISMYDF